MYTGSTGLQVAYLSGVEGLKHSPTHFTVEDVQALQLPLVSDSKFKGIDILLTSQWPKGVEKYGSAVVCYHSNDMLFSTVATSTGSNVADILFRQSLNGTGTKLAWIILCGIFYTTTLGVPAPFL